ncbi:hypothetical protein AO284_29145 [Pseudomonas sp. NZIPFR-PS2]|nr:hypothetical protein AO284_29145 [Pseudomonas sp. NZIPFR-PS2]
MPALKTFQGVMEPQELIAFITFEGANRAWQVADVPQGFKAAIHVHHTQLPALAEGPGAAIKLIGEHVKHLHAQVGRGTIDQVQLADAPHRVAPGQQQRHLPAVRQDNPLGRHGEMEQRRAAGIRHHCTGLAQCHQITLVIQRHRIVYRAAAQDRG